MWTCEREPVSFGAGPIAFVPIVGWIRSRQRGWNVSEQDAKTHLDQAATVYPGMSRVFVHPDWSGS